MIDNRLRAALLVAGCGALITGCISRAPDPGRLPTTPPSTSGIPTEEPRSRYGNPPFYEVYGKRYFVLETAAGYREQGIASWYGPKFHGKRTSSGETYDMYAYSAAHKTLPLPSWVRVTNINNGREILLRVNDRGPFVDDRIIDLSYAAAQALDVITDGTAPVIVEALISPQRDVPPTQSSPATSTVTTAATDESVSADPIVIQVGAFGDVSNANALQQRLERAGVDGVYIRSAPDNSIHRVRIGPLSTTAAFDVLMQQLRSLDIRDARLVPITD
ncbi:MAG: septal ring lytic transglycosylase RlpA family protein [Pseudomonadota bacterium]